MNANVTDGCLIPIDYCRAHDYHRRFYVLQLDLQHTMHRSTEDRHQRLERVDHVTHANDVTLETQMQFIQTRANERKCKCKRKLARERKRARGTRKTQNSTCPLPSISQNIYHTSAVHSDLSTELPHPLHLISHSVPLRNSSHRFGEA